MPLNFPSAPSNGQTYTDDNAVVWEFDGVKWNVITGTANKAFSGAKIKLSTDYSLTATNTAISFDTELIDTDSYYFVSSPTRITINKNAFYRLNLSLYTGSSGASYTISIKKNGSTNLSTVVIAPNQYTNYDEIVELLSGDYIEVFVSESGATGTLLPTTFFEITRVGLLLGTSVPSSEAFSGVRGTLSADYSTTNTTTALTWSSTQFNQNANAAGNTYWTVSDASKFTISTAGFYRVKSVISVGSTDNYSVNLKQNNVTTLSTTAIDPNGFAQIDEIYQFNQNDYLQLFVRDNNSTGSIKQQTYLEITRVGV